MKNSSKFVIIAVTLLMLLAAGTVSAAAKPPTFSGANWIWHKGVGQAAGTWYFQKGMAFPAGQKPKKAHVLITCDNLWTLHVNGKQVGRNDSTADSWQRPQSLDVAKHLVIEKNAIAIAGTNTAPGPSGLLVKLVVEFEDVKKTFELVSDKTWISSSKPTTGWKDNGFTAGPDWTPVTVVGAYGSAPWGKLDGSARRPRGARKPAPLPAVLADKEELKKPIYKDGVVFVGSAVGLNVNRQPIYHQNIRGTRAYFEMDPMTPAALGRQLWSLIPLGPDGKKTLLCDAGQGTVGSPSVSFDGKTVYFTKVKPGEAFFHIYKIDMTAKGDAAPGGEKSVVQLTDGPFHDYDPMELPDGRIAFSSTRIGSREEYHGKYASSLWTYDPKSKKIRPLTYHIVADREPRVTSDGQLAFIRSDNFLERAKVEAHLHQTRMDGTAGQVIIGPGRKGVRLDRDVAAEPAMNWLRRYGIGSPAPMPDGRVAAINQRGLVTSATATGLDVGGGFLPFDLSPLPDSRLLCTARAKNQIIVFDPKDKSQKGVFSMNGIHSVVHLGARKKPSVMPSMVDPAIERSISKTGFLYCQNVLNTQHTSADTKRIKAIRVYEGRPFTIEPTKAIYVHIGTVGIELGTVPLASDGSFYIEVPADRPLALQAIDGEGRAVINELSWIYTRPGEQRACVGCHAPVDAAPSMTPAKAMRSRPLKLTGQGAPHRFRANNGANGGIVNLQLDKFREVVGINLNTVPNDASLSTIRRLGILRNRSSIPILVKALGDKSPEMRCAAALSLSACGNRDAIKPLMISLKDTNPTVARAAACALEHLTGNPAGGTDFYAIEKALIGKISPENQLTGTAAPVKKRAPKIIIKSALYGVKGKPSRQVDLTKKISKRVAAGKFTFSASHKFAGKDPAPGINKTTELEYSINGKLKKASLREGAEFDLVLGNIAGPGSVSSKSGQEIHMAIEALGHVGGNAGKKAIRDWLASNPKGELRMLMAAIRSLGYLQDRQAIPDLVAIMNANLNKRGKGGWNEGGFNQKPTYLCATAAEALGRIGGAEVEKAILAALAKLGNFELQVMRTGEHGWLRSAQASPGYFRMLEALERMGSKAGGELAGPIVISIPVDKDRGLLYELDSYEKLVGRTVKRIGQMDNVVEACFAVLDKTSKAAVDPKLKAAVSKAPHNERHIRRLSAQSRAAQVMSVVCMDLKYADRIRKVLKTYRADKPSETRAWTCFMLTRTLGRIGDTGSIDLFVEMLTKDPTETALGLNPPPTHIIYKAWRPFYRPAAAWSLGRLKAKKATGALLKAVQELENASSTRQESAIALGMIADKTTLAELKKIAEEYPELMTRRSLLEAIAKMSK
ncbi:MAG: HEAT repeat domain-containing protein [Phycisphaerae bacterium]|jgi:HEAT repeat protein|nr:HEAT repeat domain-containing protein [Phycisphaerae bacterium]